MKSNITLTLPLSRYYDLGTAVSPAELDRHHEESQLLPTYVFTAINRVLAENYNSIHRFAIFRPDAVCDEMRAIISKEQQRHRDNRFFNSEWYPALLSYVKLGWMVVLTFETRLPDSSPLGEYKEVVLEDEKAFDSLRGFQVTLSTIRFERPAFGDHLDPT